MLSPPQILLLLSLHLLLLLLLLSPSSPSPPPVLIIGAAGAIGRALTESLLDAGVPVVAALRRTPLPDAVSGHSLLTQVFGVDCLSASSIESVFASNPTVQTVWNLAAPLSVETAADPLLAHDVVVGGMDRVLQAMRRHGVPNICFSDSIGSYGKEAPREGATAKWLLENPGQDPGSDYGEERRGEGG